MFGANSKDLMSIARESWTEELSKEFKNPIPDICPDFPDILDTYHAGAGRQVFRAKTCVDKSATI